MNQTPTDYRHTRRSHTYIRTLCAATVCAFAAVFSPVVLAADGGSVSGKVLDAAAGKYLEGAEIAVQGTEIRVTSARSGVFSLENLPAGTQTLVINYPGLDAKTETVEITPGKAVELVVKLTAAEIVQLGEFKVSSAKAGMAQAMALQKISVEQKVIAAGDQFGDINEGNIAEYLKYLPGVAITYNANDARAIGLRGVRPNFTIVAVDGNPMSTGSSSNDARSFETEQVAMTAVEFTEVFKTVSANMPASSTGGYVNLVSRSAFDREGRQIAYNFSFAGNNENRTLGKNAAYGNRETYRIHPNFEFNYADRFGKNQNIGFNLNIRQSNIDHEAPRNTYAGYVYDPKLGGNVADPYPTTWNTRMEEKTTKRRSIAGRLDIKLGENTELSFIGQYDVYDLLFHQRQINFTQNTAALTAINASDTPVYAASNGLTFAQTKVDTGVLSLQTLLRRKYGDTVHLSPVLKHTFGHSQIIASPYYSEARSRYRDTPGGYYSDLTATYVNKVNVLLNDFDSLIPRFPTITGAGNVGTVNLADLGQYKISSVRGRPFTTRDAQYGGFIDYIYNFQSVPVKLFAGLRYDNESRDVKRYDYNGVVSETGTSLAALADTMYASHDVGYYYGNYTFQSPYAVFAKYGEAALTRTASLAFRQFDETTNAGYVRAQFKASDKLSLDGGLRYETRKPEYVASDTAASPTQKLASSPAVTWDGYYPSANVTFKPNRNLVLRAGASLTVGYPDFGDNLPIRTIVPYDAAASATPGRVVLPNPNITAYKVRNFDVTAEYYLRGGGILSAAAFLKKSKNFIGQVSNQTLTADLAKQLGIDTTGFGTDPYTVSYKANFGEATIKGIELTYNQSLKFLPGVFRTMNLQTNYTHLWIDASTSASDAALLFKGNQVIADRAAFDQQAAQAVPITFNAVLDWRVQKWTFSVAQTYTGRVLYGAPWGSNPVSKTITPSTSSTATQDYLLEHDYVNARWTTDLTASYKFSSRIQAYMKVRNVFNKPISETFEAQRIPRLTTKYGDPLYTVGIKGVF